MPLARTVRVALAALLLGPCCGCVGARYVSLGPEGGIVAVPENTNVWPTFYRDKAEALMRDACPEGYVIEHQGEVTVGSRTSEYTGAPDASVSSLLKSGKTTEVRPLTEWQIVFHRGTEQGGRMEQLLRRQQRLQEVMEEYRQIKDDPFRHPIMSLPDQAEPTSSGSETPAGSPPSLPAR